MAWATQQKLVIGYDNVVLPENITAITANFTPDTGFGLDNLKYPDPSLRCRETDTSASDRIITIQFAAGKTLTCAGVIGHNLKSKGYQTVLVEWSTDGSAWTAVGTAQSLAAFGNPNFLLRFAQVSGPAWWRFTFGQSSGTRQAFEVGMLFLGTIYEFTRNAVADGGFQIIRDPVVNFVDSAGGQTWLAQGHSTFNEEAEIELLRAAPADAQVLTNQIFESNIRKIVCLLSPEQVTVQMPTVGQHFFGYLLPMSRAVRCGFGGGDKYDITLSMMGAL
jgi:hypothetical protein